MACASCGGQDEPCCVSNYERVRISDLKRGVLADGTPPPVARIIWIALAEVGRK
jgi:hypothetical protein